VIQKRLQEGVGEVVCLSTNAIVGDEHAHLLLWRKCQNSGYDVVSEFFLPTYVIKRWENLLDFSKNGPIVRSFPHFSGTPQVVY
jgi:hypothetical protein